MEITVSEALRLKNEIGQCVNTLNHGANYSSLGITKENGEEVSSGKENKFLDVLGKLKTALSYSEEINNKVASFNKDNGVDSKVRSMHNSKLLTNVFTNALPKSKSSKSARFETVGNDRKKVTIEFFPDVTGTEIKKMISEEKEKVRVLQTEIEKLNQQKLTLSFEHSDVETLVVE